MQRKIIFGIVVAILLIGGIYWFFHTKEARVPISESINAIPTDAAIIFESKQSKNTWKKLSQTNIMWEELLVTESVSQINQQGVYIDSILVATPEIATHLDNHSIFISAHSNGNNGFDLLYTISLPNLTYKSAVEEFFFENIYNSKKTKTNQEFEGETIHTISTATSHFSFSITEGIVIISLNQKLIQNSIHQLKSGISLNNNKLFNKIISTAGKNVDANVYINYQNFSSLSAPLLLSKTSKTIPALTDFADCSSWDISIKPNALMLSGFTAASDSGKSFLSLFSNQKPQEMEVIKIIPSSSNTFLFLGMSSVKTFQEDYKKQLTAKKEINTYTGFINKINSELNTDIENSMLQWMDNEMALVLNTDSEKNSECSAYAIIRSNNIEEALNTLNELSSVSKTNESTNDTASYKGYFINHLNITNLLPNLLGSQFEKIKHNYFTAIENYILFANTANEIQSYIDAIESRKTFANDKNYKAFSENISAESNVYLYNSIAKSNTLYSNFVNEELANTLNAKDELLKKFEAIGIQFSSNNKLFYSNIFLKYNPEQKQQTGTLWETKLDTTVSSRPYLLTNHKTKGKEVFVQDDANKIYLISNTGKIIWTKKINEKIMSDVMQVDVLKNNKLQLIFNTRSFIYMFDRNGNDMEGFPIKLRSPATNAISVIDYEKNRDYRIFIATENKRIVCYKANGEQLTAFAFDKTANQVFTPIQYFMANNKDHLIAIDKSGKIYILDRKGGIRVNLKEQMEEGIRNYFVEGGKDYSKSYIIAADTLGNMIKISLTNQKERIKLQDFETSPYFDYKDINNDKTKEYILLTRSELKVFGQDKALLFKYEFENKISQTPLFFLFPDNQGKIGVTSEDSNELYLFNNNGALFEGFPINGKTSFTIGDLNNEGHYNLVTGSSENSIFVYQLK